jgi:hypothetical protein
VIIRTAGAAARGRITVSSSEFQPNSREGDPISATFEGMSVVMAMLLLLLPSCSQGHALYCTCWVLGADGRYDEVLSSRAFCAGTAAVQEAWLEENENSDACSDSGDECYCACDDRGGCFSR